MERYEVQRLAYNLIEEHYHGEKRIVFQWSRAKSRLGALRNTPHNYYILELSTILQLFPESQIRDTILHEIAHAIVGIGNRHNNVWKRAALSIGCCGEVSHYYNGKEIEGYPTAKWTGICPICQDEVSRNRLTKDIESSGCCIKCHPKHRINAKIQWKKNY